MAASPITVSITVRVAWWLRPYLSGILLLARLGVEPNFGRIARVIDRAITISVERDRFRHVWSARLA